MAGGIGANTPHKRIASAAIALTMMLAMLSPPAYAADEIYAVDEAYVADEMVVVDGETETAAAYLQQIGLVKGDEKGNLQLEKTITRAELAVMMARLDGGESQWTSNGSYKTQLEQYYAANVKFKDVPDWAKLSVAYCYRSGLLKGYDNYTFGSNDPVIVNAICTLVLRWLGYKEGVSWTYDTAYV
jgi:hypothetical protein